MNNEQWQPHPFENQKNDNKVSLVPTIEELLLLYRQKNGNEHSRNDQKLLDTTFLKMVTSTNKSVVNNQSDREKY